MMKTQLSQVRKLSYPSRISGCPSGLLRGGNCRIRLMDDGSDREELGQILEGDTAVWKYVDFGKGAESAELRVRTDSPAILSLHIDTPDSAPVAVIGVQPAEGWQSVSTDVQHTEGIHALWLVCDQCPVSGSDGLSLDFIRFRR